jgi:glycosyltransferase involved in cell wall biosynthesis
VLCFDFRRDGQIHHFLPSIGSITHRATIAKKRRGPISQFGRFILSFFPSALTVRLSACKLNPAFKRFALALAIVLMPDRKKIALCLEYPLALRGGVSVLVETLLAGLKNNYDLILVSPDQPEQLARHPAAALIASHINWTPSAVSPQTSRQLAQELSRRGAALAHFHSGGVFGWGNRFPGHSPIPHVNRLGIPVCTTAHLVVRLLEGYCGPQKPLWFKLAMLPLAWTGKMQSLRSVRREIAVSKHDAEKLKRWYWPLRGKILQMYHSRLREDATPATNFVREPIVLNVGHIAWRKGQLVLAEAFAQVASRHPEWKLCLAGDELEKPIADKIRALAQTRGLSGRIQLPGPRQDALDMMRRAGIYVQPSYFEALGLALQEAMFTGCPAIGTRAGGIPELLDHERTGLLVEPGQPAQMAQALDALMSNAALRAQYGRQGAASIIERGMTAERMVANHVQLYESIFRGANS